MPEQYSTTQKLVYVAICGGGMLLFYLGYRFMVHGISEEFGLGFVVGGGIFGLLAAFAFNSEKNEELAKQREELTRAFEAQRRGPASPQ